MSKILIIISLIKTWSLKEKGAANNHPIQMVAPMMRAIMKVVRRMSGRIGWGMRRFEHVFLGMYVIKPVHASSLLVGIEHL